MRLHLLLPRVGSLARAALACAVLALAVAELRAPAAGAGLPVARAEGDWTAEFEEICSKTQDAMTLSSDELRSLVARCDRLKPAIAALDESRRKVYTRRLQLCRDLYAFVLASRGDGAAR